MPYTPREACKILGLKPTTLRKYSNVFADYLSPHEFGHMRTYTASDINILSQINLRTLRGHPHNLAEFRAGLVIPEEIANETDFSGQALSKRFAELTDQVRVLGELIKTSHEENNRLYRNYAKISQDAWYAISAFKHLEEDIKSDIDKIESRHEQFEKLKERVACLESNMPKTILDLFRPRTW